MTTPFYFAGIEGGGSGSRAVLYRQSSTGDGPPLEVASVEGGSTNHYSVGMAATVNELVTMLNKCRESVGLREPIHAVGMALAGCEGDAEELRRGMEEEAPRLARHYDISSDAIGTIHACQPEGGIIMICGTGSSARLLNPDGGVFACGGHAHLIGDGGSATWIALNAVRTVFDHEDGLRVCEESTAYVHSKMNDYFKVTRLNEMYKHLYSAFDKKFLAGFTMSIVEGAKEGDPICVRLLHDNGVAIGRHIAAVSRHAHDSLINSPNGLPVVCVGSVWKSWAFMKRGFVEGVQQNKRVKKVALLKLNIAPAIGMAFYSARKNGLLAAKTGGNVQDDSSVQLMDTLLIR